MLPRRLRLTHARDFRHVYGQRRRRAGRLVDVLTAPNALGHPRAGFSVSAKVGGSVRRNLVKRRLRAIAGGRLRTLAVGVDIVVVARPGAAEAAFAELREELDRLLGAALAATVPAAPA
ncbi:MAG TPA: ribonuclease P protein component [Candidatus Dormibacteraeota bacterium]|jgi:ribonuclease P protein component|nr:ribonuclease P protein component [Candidatus Dormibacteraeota bacterium]